MTYISINTKTKQAKKFIELIETRPFAKILDEPNTVTKKAMGEAKGKKTRKYKNAISLIEHLNK
jgi:hypothetical protein